MINIESLVRSITYKKGYSVSYCYIKSKDTISFFLTANVPNANSPEKMLTVTSFKSTSLELLERLDRTAVLAIIRAMIHQFEEHEADEWLKVDGQRVFDPHK